MKMGVKENKELVRRIYELLNQGNLAESYELCPPRFVEHFTDRDMNLEQTKQLETDLFNTFPDTKITINDMVAEGWNVIDIRAAQQLGAVPGQ
jgi:ketosteroid isomerase-like protein